MENVNVVIMDNPFGVKGSVNRNSDGSFTIIIDAHLNFEQQREVYRHEMNHIKNDDFFKDDVAIIESDAHKL